MTVGADEYLVGRIGGTEERESGEQAAVDAFNRGRIIVAEPEIATDGRVVCGAWGRNREFIGPCHEKQRRRRAKIERVRRFWWNEDGAVIDDYGNVANVDTFNGCQRRRLPLEPLLVLCMTDEFRTLTVRSGIVVMIEGCVDGLDVVVFGRRVGSQRHGKADSE